MKKLLLLIAYLVLNVIVSAGVTLLIMWWWQETHPTVCENETSQPVIQPSTLTADNTGGSTSVMEVQPTATLPPPDQVLIRIDNVFGAGDPSLEVVVLERVGEGDLWLENWRLVDQDGNQYVFPAVSFKKGKLQVYTRPGTSDLKIGLNWGSNEAIWETGEFVTVVDPMGNVRAVYQIP